MIVPGRTTLMLLIAGAVLCLAGAVQPELLYAALLFDAMVIGLCVLEGASFKQVEISVERRWPARLQIDRESTLEFVITNRGKRGVLVRLRQPWPRSIAGLDDGAEVFVEPMEAVTIGLKVTPHRRGRVMFEPMAVDVSSRHRLGVRRWAAGERQTMTVYPDLRQLTEYQQLQRSRALMQLGVHRQRQIGTGREFEQLREYLPDDQFRDINWKATARRMKPVTNLYHAERSRDVLLCIDFGRMMGNPAGTTTTLDRVIDAAVMLADTSMRHGDRVGLVTFADRVATVIKPGNSDASRQLLMQSLVDLQPKGVFTSYTALVQTLRRRQSHRALVFVFTDFNDPQLASELAERMRLISRRHVVVVVGLRDGLMAKVAGATPVRSEGLYATLAAGQLLAERDADVLRLIKSSVNVTEADPRTLTVQVINRYLSIKQRQLL